jgi:hypothetical protein
LTETKLVGALLQPVLVSVKVKLADPAETPLTTPEALTVAMASSLLVQVPSKPDGLLKITLAVPPTHIVVGGVSRTEMSGQVVTVIALVA